MTSTIATAAAPIQALDRGAVLMGANKIATGHNADDVAETVLLNILRGDVPRCARACGRGLEACLVWGQPQAAVGSATALCG
jgi:hypothetical protein